MTSHYFENLKHFWQFSINSDGQCVLVLMAMWKHSKTLVLYYIKVITLCHPLGVDYNEVRNILLWNWKVLTLARCFKKLGKKCNNWGKGEPIASQCLKFKIVWNFFHEAWAAWMKNTNVSYIALVLNFRSQCLCYRALSVFFTLKFYRIACYTDLF